MCILKRSVHVCSHCKHFVLFTIKHCQFYCFLSTRPFLYLMCITNCSYPSHRTQCTSTVLISRTRAGLSGKMDSRVDGDILLSKLAIRFIVAIIIITIIIIFKFIDLLNNFLVS